MIRDIREVRAQRNNLNIDMRIGVHSGSIMSGVIGACKWQYDIWSKDVSIANRLETTGVPGYLLWIVYPSNQLIFLTQICFFFLILGIFILLLLICSLFSRVLEKCILHNRRWIY